MKNVKVQAALRELAEEVKKIVNERIRQYGANPRAKGENTLEGSNLQRSLGVYPTENGIALLIADYWEYVSRGWERTGHGEGTFQDYLLAIKDWIRRKNIRWGDYTENEMMWILAKKMFSVKKPYFIKGRPFMIWDKNEGINKEVDLEKMIPRLNNMLDEWFDNLVDAILNDIDNFFK